MIALFHKVVPDNESYNSIFYHGYNDSACYSHIYDWWELYVNKNVKCEVLRESLTEDIDDEVAQDLLEGIADLLDDKDIQYHKEEESDDEEEEEEEESDSESDSDEEEDFENALEKARATKK